MGLSHFTVMSRFLLPFLCIVLVTFTESRRYRSRSDTTTTTSMTSEEDEEYMTAAKSLIDAGTCDEGTSNDVCGGDPSSSYYKKFQYNGYRVIISNGVPDHQAEHDAVSSNPNTRCDRWQYMVVPINPSKASTVSSTSMGSIGLATTGGQYFNHLSAPDGSLAITNEGTSLDSCFGHSASGGVYHYHANINCTDAICHWSKQSRLVCRDRLLQGWSSCLRSL